MSKFQRKIRKLFRRKKMKIFKRLTYTSRANFMAEPNPFETKFDKIKYQFYEIVSVNGFCHLQRGRTVGKERWFWILIPLIMVIFAGVLIYLLADVYNDNSVLFTRTAPVFASQAAFPSIKICPNDPLLPMKVHELVERLKIPKNVTKNDTELALKTLDGFTRQYRVVSQQKALILNEFATLNNLSLFEILSSTTMDCHDYMRRYRYDADILDCNSTHCPGWRSVHTIYGTCCTFNYHPVDKTNFTILNNSDKFGGVQIVFSGRHLPSSGLFLVVAQPGGFVTHYDDMFALVPASDNFIRISFAHDLVTSDFESLPLKSRQCLLPTDGDRSRVFRSRCMLDCSLKIIYKECGCHPYFMPMILQNEKLVRNCTVHDLLCFEEKNDIWNAPCYACLPSCNRLKLRITSSITKYSHALPSKSIMEIYKNMNQSEELFSAFVLHASQTVAVTKRRARYNWIDLLSNLGGIFNLTLGISFITLFEILYFCLYKMLNI